MECSSLKRYYVLGIITTMILLTQFIRLYDYSSLPLFKINSIPKQICNNCTNDSFNAYATQEIINKYINKLSTKPYDKSNDGILIFHKQKLYTFKRFSIEFMDHTFKRTSILFIGDSVMYYIYSFVIEQLHIYNLYNLYKTNATTITMNSKLTQLFDELNIYNNKLLIWGGYQHTLYNEQLNQHLDLWKYPTENNSILRDINAPGAYKGFQNIYLSHSYAPPWLNNGYEAILDNDGNAKLKVIYINFSVLHLLHLYPWRKYSNFGQDVLVNLEKHFDKMVSVALNRSYTKCVIFRASNPICDMNFVDMYANASSYYNSIVNNNISTDYQRKIFEKCLQEYAIDKNDLDQVYVNYTYKYANKYKPYIMKAIDICSEKYTLLRYGPITLNERMSKYVYDKQLELNKYANIDMKLIYFDVYKLFDGSHNCKYSDSRHFQKLLPVQASVLTNIVSNFCS